MIRHLLCLPPIAEAAARAFPVGQGDEAGRGDGSRGVVAAAYGNVETDADAGTCRVAGRKNPLIHQVEGHGAHQAEEVGTGSNAAVEVAADGATTMP
jgi:hypothetical protein